MGLNHLRAFGGQIQECTGLNRSPGRYAGDQGRIQARRSPPRCHCGSSPTSSAARTMNSHNCGLTASSLGTRMLNLNVHCCRADRDNLTHNIPEVRPPTDSSKDSKQMELTERESRWVESQVLTLTVVCGIYPIRCSTKTRQVLAEKRTPNLPRTFISRRNEATESIKMD